MQETYIKRVSKVFEYIHENLDSELNLEKLSDIAYFSPFHFHRIFKSITGETLNEYITRQRIEKAASHLLHTNNPIADIGFQFGFKDASSFTRSFKKYYNQSPTEFKSSNPRRFSKIGQVNSKNGQVIPDMDTYLRNLKQLNHWIDMNATIEITTFEPFHLVYLPVMGPQNLGITFNQLIKWAGPQGLMTEENKVMTVYHDSFKFTPPHKLRMSASLSVQKEIKPEGEISFKDFDPGKCICARFEIDVQEFEKSWTGLFLWMNENGFKKSDKDPFEIYHNNFNEHPEGIAIVDFCIPVV